MSLTKIPALKSAILNLPEREKDKLLIRLINKDIVLMNQLHFQLLEDDVDLEDRRERILKSIDMAFQRMNRQLQHNDYYTARFLMMDLKFTSGYVNEHALITKDKWGEIECRLTILSKTFQYAGKFFSSEHYGNEKLFAYITGRFKNVIAKYDKLHEDLQFDFQEKLNELLDFAYSSALKPYLVDVEIPKKV